MVRRYETKIVRTVRAGGGHNRTSIVSLSPEAFERGFEPGTKVLLTIKNDEIKISKMPPMEVDAQ